MPRKANKPPLEQWEFHKETIKSLASVKPWVDVREEMAEQHSFFASRDQFDAQMRAWGYHKNLKKHEWRASLRALDRINSRHERKIKMRILNEPVSDEKIKRARAKHSGGDSEISEEVPSSVSFGFVGRDGEWVPFSSSEDAGTPEPQALERIEESQPVDFASMPFESHASEHNLAEFSLIPFESPASQPFIPLDQATDFDFSGGDDGIFGGFNPITADGFNARVPNSNVPEHYSLVEPLRSFEENSTFDPQISLNNSEYQFSAPALEVSSSQGFEAFQFSAQALKISPFEKFEGLLQKQGIDLSRLRSRKSPSQALVSVETFFRDAVYMTPFRFGASPHSISRRFQQKFILQSLQSLLPDHVSAEHSGDGATMTRSDTSLGSNLIRILVFSIANGFSGLESIPISSVLAFLDKYVDMDAHFVQILKKNGDHVSKSLAENLFKAAIEAENISLVKLLLDTNLVRVNEIICNTESGRLTVAERVAQLQNDKIMEVLLDHNVDLNKTFASTKTSGGSLSRLLYGIGRGETISSKTWDFIKTLLRSKARVVMTSLNHVICSLREPDLAFLLLSHSLESSSMDYISHNILAAITSELERKRTAELVDLVLRTCDRLHRGECVQKYADEVEWALVQGARRGHLEVVKLLLPLSTSLDAALSASIRSKDKTIVNMILERTPRLDAPAQSISIETDDEIRIREDWMKTTFRKFGNNLTTPLAEAIKTKDNDLVDLCESLGALNYLHIRGHLKAALVAAASKGNLSFIHKLLEHQQWTNSEKLSYALLESIQNSHDEITLALLDAGAEVDRPVHSDSTPLYAAVLKRNALVVRRILNSGSSLFNHFNKKTFLPTKPSKVLEAALQWGDESIILDLCLTFPSETIGQSQFIRNELSHGRKSSLELLIKYRLVKREDLTFFLEGAINSNNAGMVKEFIELGADPSDNDVLELATTSAIAADNLDILKILLSYIPKPKLQIKSSIGTNALCSAIEAGMAGIHAVEALILSNVVDIYSFRYDRSFERLTETPLGSAIRKAAEWNGRFPAVECLIKAGCDPKGLVFRGNNYEPQNRTALLAAIKTGNPTLVALLLHHGADPNTTATLGLFRTPLQLAAEIGSLEIIELLITEGAGVNGLPPPRQGGTALQFAAINGNCNIARKLLEHGANASMPPPKFHGRWPLEGAAEHGRLEMIYLLFNLKQPPSPEQCKSAMKLAQKNGHFACSDLIEEQLSMMESRGSGAVPGPSFSPYLIDTIASNQAIPHSGLPSQISSLNGFSSDRPFTDIVADIAQGEGVGD